MVVAPAIGSQNANVAVTTASHRMCAVGIGGICVFGQYTCIEMRVENVELTERRDSISECQLSRSIVDDIFKGVLYRG